MNIFDLINEEKIELSRIKKGVEKYLGDGWKVEYCIDRDLNYFCIYTFKYNSTYPISYNIISENTIILKFHKSEELREFTEEEIAKVKKAIIHSIYNVNTPDLEQLELKFKEK